MYIGSNWLKALENLIERDNEDDETIICSLKKQLNQLQTICTQTR